MARFFAISLAALAVTTWTFLSFVFSSRPEDGEANALASLVRLPASIPGELPRLALRPKTRPIEQIEMNVVELKCWDKSNDDEQSTSARWVRITGHDCGHAQADSVSIRNLSNGYTATVFPTAKKALTTDYIPLVVGANQISIKFNGPEGDPVENQIALVRE